ncbi:hypothetical protein ACWGH8_36030 [Nonomuraea muscovyensis]|uniref:Uncharacterized protein n=1 Tax=Nonomuraea muscovyensis TaxID=1124761 RepID=A0A7X0EVU8_9ACTN|nr:hypothetical protein [Nonomuraea muscovyensis]MBB6345858.1 hypothetical protein [Nonomuraea muscovyensis]
MRQTVRRGGDAFALCTAVLGIAVLLHLTFAVLTSTHSAHQHGTGAQQPAVGITDPGAHTSMVVTAGHDPTPCHSPPSGHDHSRCGAVAGTPITDARPLLPTGLAIGHVVIGTHALASTPSPIRRRHGERPACSPAGAALLILNSVSRI